MPTVSSLLECKVSLPTVIADHLDRMQIASSHFPRCHGRSFFEVYRSSFAFDSGLPRDEEWKRWGLGILWRPMSSDCDLLGSHRGAPKVTRIKSQDELNIENKSTYLSTLPRRKTIQMPSTSKQRWRADSWGWIHSLSVVVLMFVCRDHFPPWRISDLR